MAELLKQKVMPKLVEALKTVGLELSVARGYKSFLFYPLLHISP